MWFTGNAYPGPLLPYEDELKSFLDSGGHLFVSGQDILDQAAGTTDFVRNYLHITWDGSETQNDQATEQIHAVAGSPASRTACRSPGPTRSSSSPSRWRRTETTPSARI